MLENLLSIIFPASCPGCGNLLLIKEKALCTSCLRQLPINVNLLRHRVSLNENVYKEYLHELIYFLDFEKESIVQNIMHSIKYRNDTGIALEMGKQFGQYIKKIIPTDRNYVLVPVPLHYQKERKRGYNQSELIAKGIGETLGVNVNTNILKRDRSTETQTHKSKNERINNLMGAFTVESDIKDGHTVILVDDVYTTGSTVTACFEILKKAGCSSVISVALCKTR